MNHTDIAMQALQYRMATVSDSFTGSTFDARRVAEIAVECGDPVIDSAIRRIGTAWVRSGLAPEAIVEPWSGPRIDAIFGDDPSLLDALDDVIKAVHRVQFARPRGGTISAIPKHRPGTLNYR